MSGGALSNTHSRKRCDVAQPSATRNISKAPWRPSSMVSNKMASHIAAVGNKAVHYNLLFYSLAYPGLPLWLVCCLGWNVSGQGHTVAPST